jgi:hypothetical protein
MKASFGFRDSFDAFEVLIICPIRNPKEPIAANQKKFSAHADYPQEILKIPAYILVILITHGELKFGNDNMMVDIIIQCKLNTGQV